MSISFGRVSLRTVLPTELENVSSVELVATKINKKYAEVLLEGKYKLKLYIKDYYPKNWSSMFVKVDDMEIRTKGTTKYLFQTK